MWQGHDLDTTRGLVLREGERERGGQMSEAILKMGCDAHGRTMYEILGELLLKAEESNPKSSITGCHFHWPKEEHEELTRFELRDVRFRVEGNTIFVEPILPSRVGASGRSGN